MQCLQAPAVHPEDTAEECMKESLSNRDPWDGCADIVGIVVILLNSDLFEMHEFLDCMMEGGVLRDILLSMNNGERLDVWHT